MLKSLQYICAYACVVGEANMSPIFRKETAVLDTTDGHRACMRFKTAEGDVILSKFDQYIIDITAVAMRIFKIFLR